MEHLNAGKDAKFKVDGNR